jgi:hypothetical protein
MVLGVLGVDRVTEGHSLFAGFDYLSATVKDGGRFIFIGTVEKARNGPRTRSSM